MKLLLIPQRYEFSSKSQRMSAIYANSSCCCWYHKGTNFQANHNVLTWISQPVTVVADTTKVRIFKQITTDSQFATTLLSCCWYHKGTNFQANHNTLALIISMLAVVADTTKVRIFKQITTESLYKELAPKLLLIPQRYEFSSKSQLNKGYPSSRYCCCWYHKGTNFQANHNGKLLVHLWNWVVADTTKVRIFKQITTSICKAWECS